MCYPCTHCNKCGKYPQFNACKKCGTEREANEPVCKKCGTPFPAPPGVPLAPREE